MDASPQRPHLHPPGTAPRDERVRAAIAERKAMIGRLISDPTLLFYRSDDVRRALEFWKVQL